MKVCFMMQRRFAYISHNLAVWLKEKYGVKDFCGYVFMRWSYDWLKQQKDVQYQSLLLDEDVHARYKQEPLDLNYIKQLEAEYGLPNLWAYIALDRIVMFNQLVREYPYNTPQYTHEEMMRIFQVKARALIEFVEREKPDVMVYSALGVMGGYFLNHLAKKKGIKTLGILPACTASRQVISEDYAHFTDVEKIFKANLAGRVSPAWEEAKAFLDRFRANPAPYNPNIKVAFGNSKRAEQFKFLRPANLAASISWFWQIIRHYLKTRHHQDYSDEMHPWYYLVDHVKRKVRNLIGINDLYDAFDPDVDFAFYPLHMEPEIALLMHAPFFTNQLELIRTIARSLPLHYKLYVKEHPYMAGFRPRRFYKELKKIPNVKLMPSHLPSGVILPKTKLITTIISSAAWEGLLLKKPVITFGDQFFNALSMTKKCTTPEQLPYLIKAQLENFKFDEAELMAYLAALFEDTVQIDLPHLWERETDEAKKKIGLEPLADLLAKKLGLTA